MAQPDWISPMRQSMSGLNNRADPRPILTPQRILVLAPGRVVSPHVAGVVRVVERSGKPFENLDRRCLAGSVRPQQREYLAGRDIEPDTVEHVGGPVPHSQTVHVDRYVWFAQLHPLTSCQSRLTVLLTVSVT